MSADAATLYNQANGLREAGQELAAIAHYDRALAIAPDFFQAWHNRGSALHALGRNEDAVASFDRVLAINPAIAESWNNRGIALAALNRGDDALASYDRALALNRAFASAWDNRGMLLRQIGRADEARASHEQALAINPGMAEAWFNRGNVLRDQRQSAESLASYDRALAIRPNDVQTWINRAMVLRDLGRIAEALASSGKALAINPDNPEALYSHGITAWVENNDYNSALRDFEHLARVAPDYPYALGSLMLVRQFAGDWRNFNSDKTRIDDAVRAGKTVTEPFVYQAINGSPADLQACSVLHARHRYPAQPAVTRAPRRADRIRIGYVSGEFREQATAYLMAGLYEHHDKSRFAITAFDNGGSDNSPMRQRLEMAFDDFVDISRLSDRDAAEKIAGLEIDILINLNGYFGDHRMGVFAHRPAPLQVHYLGFPATSGAPYMDYIIADPIVIPGDERRFYTEQVVWLPDSYQANDARRAIAKDIPSRTDCGLPENAFVFCNFNTHYKLTPQSFAAWMRIMKQVPGSVLWLLQGLPQFSENLRVMAEAQGVAGTRLIFAPMTPLPAHLARLTLADLFLDSLPYNAHTTASDALWAGVPLVTCRGTAFAGRVAASLLAAVGMPELVTENWPAYEALAVTLAHEPARLAALRQRLARNRLTAPLFDTDRFRRHLEIAFITMRERQAQGLPPAHFAVSPSDAGDIA